MNRQNQGSNAPRSQRPNQGNSNRNQPGVGNPGNTGYSEREQYAPYGEPRNPETGFSGDYPARSTGHGSEYQRTGGWNAGYQSGSDGGDQRQSEQPFGGGYPAEEYQGNHQRYQQRHQQHDAYGSGTSGDAYRGGYGQNQSAGYQGYPNQGSGYQNEANQGSGYQGYGNSRGSSSSQGGGTYGSQNQYGSSGSGGSPASRSSWSPAQQFGDEDTSVQSTRGAAPYGSSSSRTTMGSSMTEHKSRKGPKGYQRSDDRLREEIVDALLSRRSIELDEVEIQVNDGSVTLTGTVQSRQQRYEIEDVADGVWGVKEITNNIKVGSGSTGASASETSSKDTRSGSSDASPSSKQSASSSTGFGQSGKTR